VQAKRLLHGIIDIHVEPYVDCCKETDHCSFRRSDELFITLKIRYERTNVLKYTYFHRVVGTWNSLTLSICEATSVNSFKALVKKYFYGLIYSLNVFLVIIFNIYYYPIFKFASFSL